MGWKAAVRGLGVVLLVSAAPAQFPVLIYHAHPNLQYDESAFRGQMDFLAANDYSTVTPEQFHDWRVNDAIMPYRPVLLTVDDNYILLYTSMFPILRDRGQTIVNFVITGSAGNTSGLVYCSWNQIREMQASGAVLSESHTVWHPHLTQLEPLLSLAELRDSKLKLEAEIPGNPCRFLAYPYGDYNQTIINQSMAAGYDMAFSTITDWNYRDTPLYEIRRLAGDGISFEHFKAVIGHSYLPPDPPGDGYTIDNEQVNFSADEGTWTLSPGNATAYGVDYRWSAAGAAGSAARWAAYLPEAGTFRIHATWASHAGAAPDARYTIHHGGGTSDVVVDQRVNGGQWVLLGTYTIGAGEPAIVTLSPSANGVAVADGVWFQPVPTRVEDAFALE